MDNRTVTVDDIVNLLIEELTGGGYRSEADLAAYMASAAADHRSILDDLLDGDADPLLVTLVVVAAHSVLVEPEALALDQLWPDSGFTGRDVARELAGRLRGAIQATLARLSRPLRAGERDAVISMASSQISRVAVRARGREVGRVELSYSPQQPFQSDLGKRVG